MTDRISRLADVLRAHGCDAYLAQTAISMGYLKGVWEDAHERFMTLAISATGDTHLICPALSETQARKAGVSSIDTWADGGDPLGLFSALATRWGLSESKIAVDDEMPARMLLQVQNALPNATFVSGGKTLDALMAVKDETELNHLRAAGKIADEAFREVLPQLRVGLTERQVSKMLSDAMESRCGKTTFSIVGVGANAAEPHHLNDDTPVAEGVLLMDFGCELNGYQSDITRTVYVGTAPEEVRSVYRIVHAAHMAGRAAIVPGATGADVDAAARKVIDDAGFGEFFFHRLGHGIGLRGHEAPDMASYNQTPLVPGNCFSIEPGIYLAGKFGIRIENIVTSTATGHESFNEDPASEIIEV